MEILGNFIYYYALIYIIFICVKYIILAVYLLNLFNEDFNRLIETQIENTNFRFDLYTTIFSLSVIIVF